MDLTLERWDRLSPPEREALARRVGKILPDGFTFEAIRPFSLGDQRHEVAMFRRDGAAFALIPGGERRLGFDAGRGWEPTPEERESWEETAEEYGFEVPLGERVAEVTLRPRVVEIRPFLLETGAAEVGWEPVPLDDPDVRELLEEHGSRATNVQVSRGEVSTRVRRG